MSHRQSCDRCRQQKVRCRRDEAAQRGKSNTSSTGQTSLLPCERCTKAAVDCVYSRMCLPNFFVQFGFIFITFFKRGGNESKSQLIEVSYHSETTIQ